jgi:hypothetical protein
MTIELKTPAAAQALADYLERCGCTVVFASEQTLHVKVPARSCDQRGALIELQAYVRVWSAMYPDHEVNVSEEA